MEIRKLSAYDAPIYQKIRLKALLENPESYSSSYEEEQSRPIEYIEERLSQIAVSTFGAFIEDMLVGIVTFVKETRIKTRHTGDLYAMYVDSRYRRQKIGTALVNHILSIAKENQVTEKIRLAVTVTNTSALKLYETLGFKTYCHETKSVKINDVYYGTYYMEYVIK
ncbi:MAG: GNAT family N-acetyltransferase [Acholeplasmataceae bacterium]|jgi:ribosomal protein S18 acetylase RimI-like enzyme|nr:GNAT family N-acetyltransferase [Acholeplasmataceae bacterium]